MDRLVSRKPGHDFITSGGYKRWEQIWAGMEVAGYLLLMIRKITILVFIFILCPSGVHSLSFGEDGLETHIGAGGAIYAPFHFHKSSFGYNLSLTMRPSYARYMFDELEKWNMGFSIQSQIQHISDNYSFRDVCFTLRYYFNRGEFGPDWESGFVGLGCGIASVIWETESSSGRRKDTDFILEAGYEVDLWDPIVLMFSANYRVIDIEPVSYTGLGLTLSICYGVAE